MSLHAKPDPQIDLLRETIAFLVRSDGPDLTARQLAVLLTLHLREGPHTVRGLASVLNVGRSAITRALDRLGEFDLMRREVDPKDRRSVLVQRTPQGNDFLRGLHQVMADAAKPAGRKRTTRTSRSAAGNTPGR